MLPLHPIGWHNYLCHTSTTPASSVVHHSYVSWEDAVWDLVRYFAFPRPITALIPEFYCVDVIANMRQHGIECVTYPVDSQFQTQPAAFRQHLETLQPQIVIILHAVGITNTLFDHQSAWLSALPAHALLIEDSVHRIVNPRTLSFITDHHVVIDSLRKVVPLPGANLYGTEAIAQLKPTKAKITQKYRLAVLGWWVLFQICLLLVRLLPFHRWRISWSMLAEQTMLRGYDRIGDSQVAGCGYGISTVLSAHIAHQHIAACKRIHVQQYQQVLAPVWQSPSVFRINFPESDWGKLRAFPVGLTLQNAASILDQLRRSGLIVRFELDGCAWSKQQKVIYLPLGPHLHPNEIISIAELVRDTVLHN